MPPLHPAIVHFPIVLVAVSVLADLVAYLKNNESARTAAEWSLLGATLTAALAVVAGFYDMNRADLSQETHQYVHLHQRLGLLLLVALTGLSWWRGFIQTTPYRTLSGRYLAVAGLVLALTLFQGWYGGEMVYSHGAGVAVTGQGTEPAKEAQGRLTDVYRALAGPAANHH